jgi:hypothetical protein
VKKLSKKSLKKKKKREREEEEEKKPWCLYLATKYLSNGKNRLTNPRLKYPVYKLLWFLLV